ADVMIPGNGISAGLMRRLDFRLQTGCLQHFDGLMALSLNACSDFAPHVPRILTDVALSAELAERLAATPEPDDDPEALFTIVYTGWLDGLRGIPLLLEAFKLLEESRYRLVITGRGELQHAVKKAANADTRITYLGYLPSHDDVVALYARASVLVNLYRTDSPTLRYAFPSKVLEYLATGRPVVSTCTAGMREGYADIVTLLEEETPEALADLLRQVESMDTDTITQRGRTAKEFMLKHKTWDRTGRHLAAFIRDVTLKAGEGTDGGG
ncbi:MAG: glycosyltransferase, partial [Armatimonadota bacterium]